MIRPASSKWRAGLLNAIGLANVGLEGFIAAKLPFIEQMPHHRLRETSPVIASTIMSRSRRRSTGTSASRVWN